MEVLRGVIEEYIASGDPVGSRTLSKDPRFALSAATIRNIMADLEDSGHLAQPHTSAGRVPTDKGYRWYVDHIRKSGRLPGADESLIQESLDRGGSDLDAVLDLATQLLARLSHYVGVIVTPRIDTSVLASVSFVCISKGRILVILATSTGSVQHKVVDVTEEYSVDELGRLGQLVTESFRGLTLREVRRKVVELMQEERAKYDALLQSAMGLADRTFADAPGIHIEGAVNMLDAPEFSDTQKIKGLLITFQDRERLVRILDEVIEGRGLQVIIGSESQIADLSGISLVSASYRAGETSGALGVLGPTRMDYQRTVRVVDRVAESLSQKLQGSEEKAGGFHG
ncbi:MAG: heat-inducible transcriptional repressor HrcA [Acidobacteriota bacterium]